MRAKTCLSLILCLLLLAGCTPKSTEQSAPEPSIEREVPSPASESEPEELMPVEEPEPKEADEDSIPPIQPESSKDAGNIMNEYGFKNIGNSRYNFWLTIPQDWAAEDTSANGDGLFITCDNPSIDIRAYGENVVTTDEEYQKALAESGEVTPFLFTSGDEGQKLDADRYVLFTYTAYDRHITFYVDYSGDPDWYAQNREMVESVAKTLRDGD